MKEKKLQQDGRKGDGTQRDTEHASISLCLLLLLVNDSQDGITKGQDGPKQRITWAIYITQFFWPNFWVTKCTGNSWQQRIPKHMPGRLSRCLLARPLKTICLIILDSTSQLSRIYQSQRAITSTTTVHQTATSRYVRPPRDYCVLRTTNLVQR
jgi:hypothetical protein